MKKLFKFLLLGAFTLSLGVGFVGCDYVKESELKKVCERIDAMEADIETLEGLVNPIGKVVVDVTGPSADGKLTVTYTEGPSREIQLSIGGKAPYVEKNNDGSYTLYVVPKGGTDYEKVLIPTVSNAISKIDILGWMSGKGEANEDISSFNDVRNHEDDTFYVNYAWIEKFLMEDRTVTGNFSGSSDNATKDYTDKSGNVLTAWSAQTDIVVKNVLNTLNVERQGILVQVHPTSVDMTKLKFTLENSKGAELPILMKEPELITGLLTTRAATSSALYFIPWTYEDKSVTYEKKNSGDQAPVNYNYEDKFAANARYTLVTSAGLRSEYTHWTVIPNDIASREAAVDYLLAGTTKLQDVGGQYKVEIGVNYSIKFEDPANPAKSVVDYWAEVKDNNDYVRTQFDVTFDKKAGTFNVGKLPDELTLATFKLTVYKLGVDGKVYLEDITIYPIRKDLSEVIFNGKYTITDENTHATAAVENAPAPTSGQLSVTNNVPMADMFTMLAGQASGISGMTMKERWQNITYGAKFWELASVTIGGKAVDGSSNGYKPSVTVGGDDSTPQDLDDWKNMFYMGGSKIEFTAATGNVGGSNPNVGMNPDSNGDAVFSPDLYKAQFIKLSPAYAQANKTTPMFEIGKEYILTFKFYDKKQDANEKNLELSSAVIKFVPELPTLADLFKKDLPFWTTDETILKAYYKAPGDWAATDFYGSTVGTYPTGWTPAPTNSTFFNVYSTGAALGHSPIAPYDAGFTKFAQAANGDKQWIGDGTTLAIPNLGNDNEQKIGTAKVSTLVVVNGSTVELKSQYPASKDVKGAYGATLDMAIELGKYLDVYDYSDYDMYKDALAALGFKMEIMSALEKGSITGSEEGTVEAASTSEVYKLDADDFDALNYNKSKEYSLFKTFIGGSLKYDYTYVKSVEFYIPSGNNYYYFVDEDNVRIDSDTTVEIPATQPTPPATTPAATPGYIAIKGNELSNTITTEIGVRVTDRYGKIKDEKVKLTIKVN